MLKKIKRTAQTETPPPAPPPADSPMPPPLLPMDPPTQQMSSPLAPDPNRQELDTPLDGLGKIFYDIDIKTHISNSMGKSADDLALEIWEMYGGNEIGGADKEKQGKRPDNFTDLPPEGKEKELERTERKRWERLPAGKVITNITILEDLTKMMNSLIFSVVREESKGGESPSGGMPMMAKRNIDIRVAKIEYLLKYANDADKLGLYKLSNKIDHLIKNLS